MQNKTTKNHFSPEVYLKGFLNEDGRLFCIKKVSGKWVFDDNIRNPGDIMFKKKDHPQLHEDHFTKLENAWTPILKNLQKNILYINKKNKVELANFLAWQFERAPANRKIAKEWIDKKLAESFVDADARPDLTGKQKAMFKKLFPKVMNTPEVTLHFRQNPLSYLVEILLNLDWNFLIAPYGASFISTDRAFRVIKLQNDENAYTMPLTQKVSVWILDNKMIKRNYINEVDITQHELSNINLRLAQTATNYMVSADKKELIKAAYYLNNLK